MMWGRRAVKCAGVGSPASQSAARLARCRQLFRCSPVGLRQFHPFFGARDLALVPLQ